MSKKIELYWYEGGVLETRLVKGDYEVDQTIDALLERKVPIKDTMFQCDHTMGQEDAWWYVYDTNVTKGRNTNGAFWRNAKDLACPKVPEEYLMMQLLMYHE